MLREGFAKHRQGHRQAAIAGATNQLIAGDHAAHLAGGRLHQGSPGNAAYHAIGLKTQKLHALARRRGATRRRIAGVMAAGGIFGKARAEQQRSWRRVKLCQRKDHRWLGLTTGGPLWAGLEVQQSQIPVLSRLQKPRFPQDLPYQRTRRTLACCGLFNPHSVLGHIAHHMPASEQHVYGDEEPCTPVACILRIHQAHCRPTEPVPRLSATPGLSHPSAAPTPASPRGWSSRRRERAWPAMHHHAPPAPIHR